MTLNYKPELLDQSVLAYNDLGRLRPICDNGI
jgi:hypothetical protein